MITRLYLPQASAGNEEHLSAEQSHYLLRVLRIKTGNPLNVFDGKGGEYTATMLIANKNHVTVQIGKKKQPLAADADIRTHIAQATCTTAKMDWAIEKMTELGVSRITPLITAHTHTPRAPIARWQRLAAAASSQCGRATVPVIDALTALSDFLADYKSVQKIFFSPHAEQPLSTVYRPTQPAVLLFGPESGLSNAEEEQAKTAGFVAANLGARVLRAETAAIAALAMLMALST